MLYRELNTVGDYLSPAAGGGKITSTQFFLIDKGILQWCAKGIVTKNNVVIQLTHHKNSGYTEIKVLGVYF